MHDVIGELNKDRSFRIAGFEKAIVSTDGTTISLEGVTMIVDGFRVGIIDHMYLYVPVIENLLKNTESK